MSGKRQVGAGPSGGKEGGDGPVRKRPRAGEVSKSLFDQLNEQDRRQAQQNVQVFPDSEYVGSPLPHPIRPRKANFRSHA